MRESYWVIAVSRDGCRDEIRRAYRQFLRRREASGLQDAPTGWEIRRAYASCVGEPRSSRCSSVQSTRRPPDAFGVADAPWSADEVAVDFPSVAPGVDRIRDGFLRHEQSTQAVSTEVKLTEHEARQGAVIPLEVPVRCTCLICGGRGEIWTEPCTMCRGSGSDSCRHHVRLSVPAGVRQGTRFHFSISPPYAPVTSVEVRIAIR